MKTNEQTQTPTAKPLAPATGYADLPGCIRRELRKMKAEDKRLGIKNECSDEIRAAVAWHRWAKRKSNEEIADAVLMVSCHCVRQGTALSAKLDEAAARIRHNAEVSDGGHK